MKLDELNLSINDLSCDSILDLSSENIIVQVTDCGERYYSYEEKINLFLDKYGGGHRQKTPVDYGMKAVLLGVCLHDRFNDPLAWIRLTDDDRSILIGATKGIEIVSKGEALVTWEDVRRELIYSR